jgi:hypothetical protein
LKTLKIRENLFYYIGTIIVNKKICALLEDWKNITSSKFISILQNFFIRIFCYCTFSTPESTVADVELDEGAEALSSPLLSSALQEQNN